ncbi:MAG TPA: ComEA family DNA-binding protein [Gaiellaceae bacterium]|nr:ComEA family DNA-binding protein [Gaiellaceae bacterium]
MRRLLAGVAVAVIAVVLGVRHFAGGTPASSFAPIRATAPAHAVARRIVVDVAGAVRHPGLYRLAPGTRIADAVAIAGGATRKADLISVNLAAPLADGEQVVVGGASASTPTLVDLNSATAEQLDALPGIGPQTAEKIVAFRQAHGPFRSLEELDAVPGIGPSRIAQLKGLVAPP